MKVTTDDDRDKKRKSRRYSVYKKLCVNFQASFCVIQELKNMGCFLFTQLLIVLKDILGNPVVCAVFCLFQNLNVFIWRI